MPQGHHRHENKQDKRNTYLMTRARRASETAIQDRPIPTIDVGADAALLKLDSYVAGLNGHTKKPRLTDEQKAMRWEEAMARIEAQRVARQAQQDKKDRVAHMWDGIKETPLPDWYIQIRNLTEEITDPELGWDIRQEAAMRYTETHGNIHTIVNECRHQIMTVRSSISHRERSLNSKIGDSETLTLLDILQATPDDSLTPDDFGARFPSSLTNSNKCPRCGIGVLVRDISANVCLCCGLREEVESRPFQWRLLFWLIRNRKWEKPPVARRKRLGRLLVSASSNSIIERGAI